VIRNSILGKLAAATCKAATDAAHIAIAAVHGMDFPVTCNCVPIANAAIAKALAAICRKHACECPVIGSARTAYETTGKFLVRVLDMRQIFVLTLRVHSRNCQPTSSALANRIPLQTESTFRS